MIPSSGWGTTHCPEDTIPWWSTSKWFGKSRQHSAQCPQDKWFEVDKDFVKEHNFLPHTEPHHRDKRVYRVTHKHQLKEHIGHRDIGWVKSRGNVCQLRTDLLTRDKSHHHSEWVSQSDNERRFLQSSWLRTEHTCRQHTTRGV